MASTSRCGVGTTGAPAPSPLSWRSTARRGRTGRPRSFTASTRSRRRRSTWSSTRNTGSGRDGSCCIDERRPTTPSILCTGHGGPRWRRPCSMSVLSGRSTRCSRSSVERSTAVSPRSRRCSRGWQRARDIVGVSCCSWCSRTRPTAPRVPWRCGSCEMSCDRMVSRSAYGSARPLPTGVNDTTSAFRNSGSWSSWTDGWVTKVARPASRTADATDEAPQADGSRCAPSGRMSPSRRASWLSRSQRSLEAAAGGTRAAPVVAKGVPSAGVSRWSNVSAIAPTLLHRTSQG